MAVKQGYAVPQSAFNPQPSMATLNPSIYRGKPSAGDILQNGSSSFGQILGGLLGTINPILGSVVSLGTGLINNIWQDSRATTAYNREREQWNLQNEYNTPAAQVQRLREAGLNPLNYGLDGNSAYQMSAPQMASTAGISNPLIEGMQAVMQKKQLEAMDAQIAKTKSDTSSVELDNQFKEDTLAAREEGILLANEASRETIGKIKVEKEKALHEISLLIKQAATEEERRALVMAQTALEEAKEKEILAMLPLAMKLTEAQTLAQQAAAASSFANAAYQNGLIKGGYIDEICKKAKEDAKSAEAQATIDAFAAACKTGNPYIITEDDSKISAGAKKALNSVAREIQVFGSVLKPIAVGTNIAAKGIATVAKVAK